LVSGGKLGVESVRERIVTVKEAESRDFMMWLPRFPEP
jgi:hypothetical protein